MREVARGDLGRPQVFYLGEPKRHESSAEIVGLEVAQPGFLQLGHACRPTLMDRAPFVWERIRRIAVIKYNMCAALHCGDVRKGRTDGFFGQVRDDAKPREVGLLRRIKASGDQALRQGLAFEIDGDEGQ